LGKAIELAGRERLKNNSKIFKLRNKLIAGILKEIPDVILNTDIDNALPSHAHFSFLGAEGEAILFELDFRGIEVSTGSACASGSLEPSHVLLAMGLSPETAHGAIRFSLGKDNTAEDIQKTLKVLPLIISKLRAMNPLYNN